MSDLSTPSKGAPVGNLFVLDTRGTGCLHCALSQLRRATGLEHLILIC